MVDRCRSPLERNDAEQLRSPADGRTASTTVEWHVHRGDGEWRDLEVDRGRHARRRRRRRTRAHDARHHRAQAARRRAPAPGAPRHADQSAEPRAVPRPRRPRARARRASRRHRSASCSSISTTSRSSTTASATPAATTSSSPSPRGSTTLIRPATPSPASAATSSRCCSRTSTSRRSSSRFAGARAGGLQAPFASATTTCSCSASIGIAVGAPDTHNPDDLLRDADLAMYVAKRNGKDRYEFFDRRCTRRPTADSRSRRELRDASTATSSSSSTSRSSTSDTGRSRRRRGAGALAAPATRPAAPERVHPDRRDERTDHPARPLGAREACRRRSGGSAAGIVDDAFYVSVNLSARHLQDRDVLERRRRRAGSVGTCRRPRSSSRSPRPR